MGRNVGRWSESKKAPRERRAVEREIELTQNKVRTDGMLRNSSDPSHEKGEN